MRLEPLMLYPTKDAAQIDYPFVDLLKKIKNNIQVIGTKGIQVGVISPEMELVLTGTAAVEVKVSTLAEQGNSLFEDALRTLLENYLDNIKQNPLLEESNDNFTMRVAETTYVQDSLTGIFFGLTKWPDNIQVLELDPTEQKQRHPQVALRFELNRLMLNTLKYGFIETGSNNFGKVSRLVNASSFWLAKLEGIIGMLDSLPDILSFSPPNKINENLANRFRDAVRALKTDIKLYDVYHLTGQLFSTSYRIIRAAEQLEELVALYEQGPEKRKRETSNSSEKMQKLACQLCGEKKNLFTCAGCNQALYCSSKCQLIDWKAKHAKECK